MSMRITGLFLLAILLCESCVVYSPGVTIDKAVGRANGKYYDGSGKVHFFERIVVKDGLYCSIESGKSFPVQLPDQNVKVYLKNKSKSKKQTTGLILGIPVSLFVYVIITGPCLSDNCF